MSSWKALAWAKDQTVGSHVGKLLLLLLCEKVNERFELYPSKRQLAAEAELGRNAVRIRQDALSADGFLTVIERVRANGAQARSTVLVNHPEAPHMNGKPVVLDFQANHLYPKDPEALRAARIEWVAGGNLNATRNGNENTAAQKGGFRKAPRGDSRKPSGGFEEAPRGGSEETPLSFPQELPTGRQRTNAGAPAPTACLPAEHEPAPEASAATPGAKLLRGLALDVAVTEQVVRQHHQAVDALLETWSEQGLAAHLEAEAGAGSPRSRMAVLVKTIRSTRPRATGTQDQRLGLPVPCGECDATADSPEVARRVVEVRDERGRMRLQKCPRCHPHAGRTQKPAQQAHTATQTGSVGVTPDVPAQVVHSGDTARQCGALPSLGDLLASQ